MGGNPRPEPDPARRTLYWHAAALGVILLAFAPLSRPVDLWSADEGALRLQVETLVENGSWSLPRPLPELDPDQVTVPIHDAVVEGDVYFPFSKQPLSPVLMMPFQALFGRAWAITPSLAAVVAAAFLTGRIGARFGKGVAIASMWVIGLLTPLFLYGFTVLGHTVGAAIAAGAGLAVVAACERRRGMWPTAVLLAVVGPLVRSEAVILAGALGAAVVLTGIRDRRRVLAGIAIGAGGVVGLGLNLVVQTWLAGTVATTVAEGDVGFFERLLSGVYDSLVRADTTRSVAGIALLIAAAMAGLLAFAMRRDPERKALHVTLAAAAALPAILALWQSTPIVWGLLVACPLLVFGLASLDRQLLGSDPARLLLIAASLYALGVFVTQVEGAGGHQWGGRYFMLVLPLVVPVAIAASARLLASVPAPSRSAAVAALLVMSLVCTALSWRALGDTRIASGLLSETIGIALSEAGDAGDGDGSLLVSPVVQVGRQGWRHVIDNRFVMVPREAYAEYIGRLGGSGLTTVVVVDLYDSDDQSLFQEAGFTITPGPESPVPVVEFAVARR